MTFTSIISISSAATYASAAMTVEPFPPESLVENGVPVATAAAIKWVQCDRCNKWRQYTRLCSSAALQRQWYCELNMDPRYNSCNVAEQASTGEVLGPQVTTATRKPVKIAHPEKPRKRRRTAVAPDKMRVAAQPELAQHIGTPGASGALVAVPPASAPSSSIWQRMFEARQQYKVNKMMQLTHEGFCVVECETLSGKQLDKDVKALAWAGRRKQTNIFTSLCPHTVSQPPRTQCTLRAGELSHTKAALTKHVQQLLDSDDLELIGEFCVHAPPACAAQAWHLDYSRQLADEIERIQPGAALYALLYTPGGRPFGVVPESHLLPDQGLQQCASLDFSETLQHLGLLQVGVETCSLQPATCSPATHACLLSCLRDYCRCGTTPNRRPST